jgi:RNA-directed DNA polymerase
VRQLQRRLWAAAKRSPERRFHALYDHLGRSDVLHEAWKRVRANKGAAGVDQQTLDEVEQYGVERFLTELGTALREGRYRAGVVLRRYIPKADGRKRPLGIPTVRDRVAQMTAKLVLEPIFEADFLPCSYGFRPKRSATMALETLRKLGAKGGHHVLDADIRDYLEPSSHYTPADGCSSKSPGSASGTLILKPFLRPRETWRASSSPRFTRCNTV